MDALGLDYVVDGIAKLKDKKRRDWQEQRDKERDRTGLKKIAFFEKSESKENI